MEMNKENTAISLCLIGFGVMIFSALMFDHWVYTLIGGIMAVGPVVWYIIDDAKTIISKHEDDKE